ncbi:hypothetical protein QNN00_23060 [Bacillus velezensis]|nr:hypothetical protein [Bacillus velezensis]
MFQINGEYSVVLDARASPQEQWQDFVHELCHVLKHTGNQFHMNRMFRPSGIPGEQFHVSLLRTNVHAHKNAMPLS